MRAGPLCARLSGMIQASTLNWPPGLIAANSFALSAALYGRITFKRGKVEQGNFDDYPVLRMNEAPRVEVHLVPSDEKPGGVGEPGTPPTAPAFVNALFQLTGKRIHALPLSLHSFTA